MILQMVAVQVFMAGGMGRRAFLKLMGGAGAGIAALKTGLINIFRPRSQAVEEVIETVTKTDAMGVPETLCTISK